MFFSGVLLQMYDKQIKYALHYWVPVLASFFLLSAYAPKLTALLGGTLLAYGVVGLAKQPWFYWFGKYGDFSYGVYVYSFPVQQLVWHYTKTASELKLFALSYAVSVALGVVSWHLVESRFIKLKKHIRHEDYPLSERHAELAKAW
jgi:peptidoglycan/LPS O-acetylase OafA/YrhL